VEHERKKQAKQNGFRHKAGRGLADASRRTNVRHAAV